MLQVCAMLNSNQKTAGVPNFYLSAWAHLNLAYLWKLRNNVHNSVLHILDMFVVDPFFSRIDFTPELWKELFLPHMGSIFGWYSEERHRLVMEVIPDSSDLSFTIDLDQFLNESLIMRPDQVEKLQKLEQLFGESLDESTRLYAKYFKDCMNSNSDSTSSKKVIPMLPIAEPPMTPLHEVSRSIPDFVKFGPILPKSAGFSPFLKSKEGTSETRRGPRRMNLTSSASENLEHSAIWDPQEGLIEENEDDSDYQEDDVNVDSDDQVKKLPSPSSSKMIENKETGPKVQPSRMKGPLYSPTVFSSISSPKTSPKISPPKPDEQSGNVHATLLRLKSTRLTDTTSAASLPVSPSLSSDFSNSPVDSDGEAMEVPQSCRQNSSRRRSMSNETAISHVSKNSSLNEDNEGNQSSASLPSSEKMSTKLRPPKDFVCPITGQIFCDPVTLETGQTYERKAIQEWLKRGNTSCPITRQPLSASTLPKTNYVLKRLMTSWKDGLPDLPEEFQYSETPMNSFSQCMKDTSIASPRSFDIPFHRSNDEYINQRNKRFSRGPISTSPTSVISQAEVEKIINSLKPHVSCLCTSENLEECEKAVFEISRLWKDSKADPGVHSFLAEPTILNGFVEILSASLNRDVLRTSIYILSELIFADENVGEILTSVDSDLDCLAALLKNGLAEAAVLICQLRPAFAQLAAHDLIPSLVQLIQNKLEEVDDLQFIMEPKHAAIVLLDLILVGGDENSRSITALSVISANGIPALIKCLERMEGRRSIISILLRCMQAEKSCRNLIANRIELSPVLELFHAGNDSARGGCVGFLSELVQLNRRTFSNQILQTIKDEGAFSTMHTFLVYLQMAPMEQQPAIATLLLQLDLLVEPRKMSIYREEAIEALIEALRRKDFSSSQIMAIDALLSLIGRVTSSGDRYTEAWLLKIAGFEQPFNALMKAEQRKIHDNYFMETMEEEEKAMSAWEKKVAFVLCNHEGGSIFKALEECLRSSSLEMAKSCLVIATWLTHMLLVIPDTGVKVAARKCLLDDFINVLQSSKNLEEKILATLALRTYISDPDATKVLGVYAKCIYKTLGKLKRNSVVVTDIKKTLMNLSSVDATELWSCTELVELDSCANGEVLSLIHLKGRILSSHSDGTIKLWDAGKRVPRLIQEVREHAKAVTCLHASSSGDKVYSGSLDKTIRVWAMKSEEIHCVQVHDVKEAVYELTANSKVACFVSQGTGVEIYEWSGSPKHINFNKHVKSVAMTGTKLYCGCSGYSIQEVDLCSYTSNTFYSGTRKLLGKQTMYSLQILDGVLFAGGSSVDGTAGKIFSLSTKAIIGSFPTGFDIQRIAINNDFVFTASKCGNIEVWLKERFTKVASIKMSCGGHAKITSLVADMDGGMLYAASSDSKIQVWDLD
ncbi:hypothetical protein UlMin_034088 [Ulmus minor]